MKITSVNNDLVKETSRLLQKKYRTESKLFLLEGEKCINEAIESNIKIRKIFVLEGCNYFGNIDVIETTEAVLKKISSTESAPKAVAVAQQPEQHWCDDYKKVILLEGIKDAGNLGTIIRSACAFGVDAVVLYGDTIDLYNPKCVRSTVGNLWKVPIIQTNDLNIIKERFRNYQRVATLPKHEDSKWLHDFMPTENNLVMFGSEADGLSEELRNIATEFVTIEMSNSVESLNLAVSVGIVAYKMFK